MSRRTCLKDVTLTTNAVLMKHPMLFLAISWLALWTPIVFSQNVTTDTPSLNKQYRTWISLNTDPYQFSGYLSQISDSSILVLSDIHGVLDLQINEIETISTRGRYSSIKGALIGTLFGIALGAVIGYSQGDDEPKIYTWSFTAENKAIIGAVIGVLPGALAGYGLGSIKVVFPIQGSIDNYQKIRYELDRKIAKRRNKGKSNHRHKGYYNN